MRAIEKYNELKAIVKRNGPGSQEVSESIKKVVIESILFLETCEKNSLISRVEDKDYFDFKDNDGNFSRAINKDLYQPDIEKINLFFDSISEQSPDIEKTLIDEVMYVAAISFSANVDILKKRRDQKTPGTFFEYFVSHVYSTILKIQPSRSIQILNTDGEDTKLHTDFTFNLGRGKKKYHLPIKTSTRERAIMLWAHQKLLDGVYGIGYFICTPVILAETKTDIRKREVTEICSPDQWRVYQRYIAQINKIYYLDIPDKYKGMSETFPFVRIAKFSELFDDLKS